MAHDKHSGLTSFQEKVIRHIRFWSHHQASHSFIVFYVLPGHLSHLINVYQCLWVCNKWSLLSILDCKHINRHYTHQQHHHLSRHYIHQVSMDSCIFSEWQKTGNSSRNMRPGASTPLPPTTWDSLVSLTSLPFLLLLGAACAVCASQVRRAGNDQWHDQRGGWAPAASVPPHLHPSLWECQVRTWYPTLVPAGWVIHVCLPFASPCFKCWVWKSPSSTWWID